MPTAEDLLKKFNVAAHYTASLPAAAKMPGVATLVSEALSAPGPGMPRHVYFGEPHVNGSMARVYGMLAENPDIFTAAAAGGVRHLVLEFPQGFQRPIDAYAAKETDRKGLFEGLFDNLWYRYVSPWLGEAAEKQFQEAFIKTIDNALNAGLKIHCADVTAQQSLTTMNPPEFGEIEASLTARHAAEQSPLPVQQYIAEQVMALPEEEKERLKKIMTDFQAAWRNKRMDDTDQHDYLRASIPADEGILGVAGLAHLDDCSNERKGINFQLERDGGAVTSIAVFDSRNTEAFLAASYAAGGQETRRKPDYTIIFDEGIFDARMAPAPDQPSQNEPPPRKIRHHPR